MSLHIQADALAARINRSRGALLGLAVGDAVGTTVEFKPRGSFDPVTDMCGGGPFRLKPGQWTDDTSMALCLASSLLERGFELRDQIERYVRWSTEGYWSSTGTCFDIGNAISASLRRFRHNGDPLAGSTDVRTAGNGCIMRLAPVPIHYLAAPEQAIQLSEEQSRTTHQAPECLMACRLMAEALVRALQGADKDTVLAPSQQAGLALSPGLRSIALGEYKNKTVAQIRGSGYVVQSLEAAFWCFWHTDSFSSCVLAATNLGEDADTTAAIAGQLAGAFYGETGIPAVWLQRLAMSQEIGQLAEQLVRQAPKTSAALLS